MVYGTCLESKRAQALAGSNPASSAVLKKSGLCQDIRVLLVC